jgi:hypothetical protein
MATLPIPRTCTTSPGLNVGKATESATSRPRDRSQPVQIDRIGEVRVEELDGRTTRRRRHAS